MKRASYSVPCPMAYSKSSRAESGKITLRYNRRIGFEEYRQCRVRELMVEIISFAALPFDFIDGAITVGESIDCPSPAAAIEHAQALWKVFGHAGSVAFSRTSTHFS